MPKAHLADPVVAAHLLAPDGRVPNNRLPFLVYAGALPVPSAAAWEQLFATNGWDRSWRNGVYPFQHYHSTAHEVLGCYSGEAQVLFGGDHGLRFTVTPGDAVLIPAGVGHKNLGHSPDFGVVGAYPPGPDWDLRRARPDEYETALGNIPRVPLPATDPLYGADGPLLSHWSS